MFNLLSIRYSSWELAQSQRINFLSTLNIVLPKNNYILTADENEFFTTVKIVVICRSNVIWVDIWNRKFELNTFIYKLNNSIKGMEAIKFILNLSPTCLFETKSLWGQIKLKF